MYFLADMDRFVEDGSLEDNVESFLSQDDADPRDTVGRHMDDSKGFTFTEIAFARASTNKVICCHFSSDGKLLATGSHDKKAVLWYTDPLKPKSSLEETQFVVTDVRFSPSMPRLATSSFDRTAIGASIMAIKLVFSRVAPPKCVSNLAWVDILQQPVKTKFPFLM